MQKKPETELLHVLIFKKNKKKINSYAKIVKNGQIKF